MKKTRALLDKLIEELEKTPLIQIACDKVNISRNTFYRWMKEDKEFLSRVNEAMSLGTGLVSDVALSNVLEGIKRKDAMYTKYWLSHKHPDFRKPFIHRVEADDLLAHFRSVAEGLRESRIRDEISDVVAQERDRVSAEKEKEVQEFLDKWEDNIRRADEERAQKLFEEWKKEYESTNKKSDKKK